MSIDPVVVFFRWLHVITACVVIGCAVFMRLLLPIGLRGLAPADQEAAFLRCRRSLKLVVHSGILLFLISGIFNAMKNWDLYRQWPAGAHSLFGIHVLCALIAWAIMLMFLSGATPFQGFRAWTLVGVIVLALAVASAAALKSAREAVMRRPAAALIQPSGARP